MPPIDLRSDTVTLPTPAMRRAIAEADVGDDVYGEDPSINRLETLAAERLGKPAALLLPSGTMGNLCALLAHCGRGDEAILGDESHIYHYEAGGASALGGVVFHPIATAPDGTLPLPVIAAALRDPANVHAAPTKLICLENTHNRCGGRVLTLEYMHNVFSFAQAHNLRVHLDGARLFNAAIALGVEPHRIAQYADSIQFALSKGLAAPVGSILVGDNTFIERARRIRKMLGGGMRQAGVLAAAGIVALEQMVEQLPIDHRNAQWLAEGLAQFAQIAIAPHEVQSNIVIFTLRDPQWTNDTFIHTLATQGLLVSPIGRSIRAVTHYGIDADAITQALTIVKNVLLGD